MLKFIDFVAIVIIWFELWLNVVCIFTYLQDYPKKSNTGVISAFLLNFVTVVGYTFIRNILKLFMVEVVYVSHIFNFLCTLYIFTAVVIWATISIINSEIERQLENASKI